MSCSSPYNVSAWTYAYIRPLIPSALLSRILSSTKDQLPHSTPAKVASRPPVKSPAAQAAGEAAAARQKEAQVVASQKLPKPAATQNTVPMVDAGESSDEGDVDTDSSPSEDTSSYNGMDGSWVQA